MNYKRTELQEQVIATFREFGKRVFTPEQVRQWRRDQGLPDEVVKEFVDLYFGAEKLVEGKDDVRFSLLCQTLVIEELSRCSGATLPFQNDLFNLQILEQFAASNDFSAVLENYRQTGRPNFALAISEPEGGSDTMKMQTNVQNIDGRIILNGRKTFVNNGEYTPNILVAAIDRDDDSGDKYPALSFWFIPRALKGISAYPIDKIGQSMLPFATVVFEDVELQPEFRLTGKQIGFRQLFRLFEYGRTLTCASSLGEAQAAMEDAVAYARTRKAFGTQIGRFQQIEMMLTDMEVKLTNMRNLLYQAATAVDTAASDEVLTVALMKRYLASAATEVASDAMQILGGVGYTESHRVSQIWQDCRGNQIAEGTDQIMVYIAAPRIMEKYKD